MSLKQRLLNLFGGPVVHWLWLWRFIVIFDASPRYRIWRIESITFYDRSLEHPLWTLYDNRPAVNHVDQAGF